jgi:predicted ATPase/class 3 adenylate cyclase
MVAQPRGIVSFLFTDVEASTRVLQRLGAERFEQAVTRQRRLLRDAFARHGGYEVNAAGHGFFVAFQSAGDAVAAAVAAQRSLDGAPLRVRMAVHTGEALIEPPDYVGLEVHRAARLRAAAHGGQVLVSAVTRALVGDKLPAGTSARDLGEHWLRDMGSPDRIYQLDIAGLPSEFPALRTLAGPRPTLPAQPTRFLGREEELAAIGSLLDRDDVRLVTLTGPGGSGKTRLAIQAAAGRRGAYPDGVQFVGLAPLKDARRLPSAIALALGLVEEAGVDALALVSAYLSTRTLLLVLDNLEHLTAGADAIGTLLARCGSLKVLATSRTRLRLAAEHEHVVAPLTNPEALALFTERARAVVGEFEPDGHVTEICRQVDSLPLAVELAAGRVATLTTAQIASRLERRLPLLTGGPRDAPERQRTLRATFDWSFELLSDDERRGVCALAVFNGFTLEAAKLALEIDLDTIESLVDHSLVRREGERFLMHELVREYALEHAVAGAGERHADYFLRLAEEATPELRRAARHRYWLARLDSERANLDAALRWFVDHGSGERAHRMTAALLAFWHDAGPAGDACRWVQEVLTLDAPDRVRAPVLSHGAIAAWFLDARRLQHRWAQEGLVAARRAHDDASEAIALQALAGVASGSGRWDEAAALLDDALQRARRSGDEWTLAVTAFTYLSHEVIEDPAYASAIAEEAGALSDISATARLLVDTARGFAAAAVGDYDRAAALCRASVDSAYEMSSPKTATLRLTLSWLEFQRGDDAAARAEAAATAREAGSVGSRGIMAGALAYLAAFDALDGMPERAALVWGAVETYVEAGGFAQIVELDDGTLARYLDRARSAIHPDAWAEALARGRTLSLEAAAEFALEPRAIGVH